MDILIEVFFRGLIINFLGLYTRFYFFKLIKQNKTKLYLSGEEKSMNDKTGIITQHVFNVVVGLITFAILSFSIVYIIW